MNNPMTHNSAVRKIHNLLSSGAVTVTGPNQPRILKQKVGSTTVTPTNSVVQQQQQQQVGTGNRCYVCDDALNAGQAQHSLTEMSTSHTATKFPNKIGQLVGDAFMVIVSVEDVLCSRCTNLINYLDRLENDVERVRTNLMSLLHKKYGLNDEGGGGGTASPPIKMQKLNSGGQTSTRTDDSGDLGRTRKLLHTPDSTLGKQSPPVSAVQQIKISTQPLQTNQQQLQQTSLAAGTQTTTTIQRKTTRIYKCLSCDYKTSDMRLFNTHYETCKHQNFQCKNCKKIFPNFGAMKQHMVREHNTPMDNTCAVCHINFVNESSLRKHMEMNHSTSVVVTSTTTLPATAVVAAAAPEANVAQPAPTPLYTCTHCQFKSSDKNVFDEHLRKHLPGGAPKPKPFKCRLCAQRFETREAATIHAKQHQPNYFKCGTCSMSFPKRELLVKHFEVHQQPAAPVAPVAIAPAKQSIAPAQNLLTTQKLLQDTIDEALSDTVATTVTTANVAAATDTGAANNIRFFSCHVCSLTFIQENYYNQHMETHRRETSKKTERVVAVTSASGAAAVTTHSNNSGGGGSMTAAVALLNDPLAGATSVGSRQQQRESSQLAHANVNTLAAAASAASISEADIESIFEKMHSDKSDAGGNDSALIAASTSAAHTSTTNTATAAVGGGQDNLVITSQEGSGGITFNITIPQHDQQQVSEGTKATPTSSAPVTMSIDMPMLDQPDEPAAKHDENSTKSESNVRTAAVPVSMPSLDDDNETQEEEQQAQPSAADAERATEVHIASEKQEENAVAADNETKTEEQHMAEAAAAQEAAAAEHENAEAVAAAGGGEIGEEAAATHEQHLAAAAAEGGEQQQQQQHVAMELDEAMQAQVESGQIKFILNENGQLLQLNDHIITDADGNQILVQDPEQIQQLLQSVGVLQSGDGLDGETLQMMTDANGQMVLVQGENNETQLIDASLLNADGQLVIQQGQDGELGEGAHVIGEDGTRIPVSVSYTADGQPIVQVQQQHVMQAEPTSEVGGEDAQHVPAEKDACGGGAGEAGIGEDETHQQQQQQQHEVADAAGVVGADGGDVGGGDATASASSGGFFALEELMQQSQQQQTEAEAAKSTAAAE